MKSFNQLIEERKNTVSYKTEHAKLDFILNISRAMDERKMTRSQLAEKLNTSKAYVTKILQGDNVNFTIETMVKISNALGGNLETRIFLDDLGLIIDKNTRYEKTDPEWEELNVKSTLDSFTGSIVVKISINENQKWAQ